VQGVKCIFVGKLKNGWAKEACDHYARSFKRYHQLEEVIIKDAPGSLPEDQRRKDEGHRILAKLGPGDMLIALDQSGKTHTSKALATNLLSWLEDPGKTPCFAVGGAFGFSQEVLARADYTLSLGPMTLPHELARVVLLEQLYRAASILKGTPYHH